MRASRTRPGPREGSNPPHRARNGLAWVTLDSFGEAASPSTAVEGLRARLSEAAEQLPDPAPIRERIARMAPSELCDAAVANATCSVEAKAEYASERRLSARIERALVLVG